LGARDCPAKRAATWPRPSRAPGRPPALRARDPALLACLMTELIKVWPRFFGALGLTLNCSPSSLRRRLMGNLQRTPAIGGANDTRLYQCGRDIGAFHGTLHTPGACRAHPMCRLDFRAPKCRDRLSCPASFPALKARGCDPPATLQCVTAGRRRALAPPTVEGARGEISA